MVKTQSSLDSFFGTGQKVKKQKTLTSFFNKENSDNSNDDSDAKPKAVEKTNKRRVILDDSDDEDQDKNAKQGATAPLKEDPSPEIEEGSKPAAKEPATEKNVVTTASKGETKTTVAKPPEEKEIGDTNKTPSADLQRLQAYANKLIKLAKVEMNDKLEPISSPVKYEDLVTVFEKIEAISGRLEIQGLLTQLLRRILRDSPEDLYHAVYLVRK